jgi:hypothetical protein
VQLEGEQFWSFLKNSVGDSLYNWHDEQCSQFTDGFTNEITEEIYFVGKNDTSSFFLFCFKFFSHGNSLGIYCKNTNFLPIKLRNVLFYSLKERIK